MFLTPGLSLPIEISERLLDYRLARATKTTNNSDFIQIFRDRVNTRLKRVKIRTGAGLGERDLEVLVKHRLHELDVSLCENRITTAGCVKLINEHSDSLNSLVLNNDDTSEDLAGITMPNLRKMALRDYKTQAPIFATLLRNMTSLTHLDLSGCCHLDSLDYAAHLHNLTSLVLYNVPDVEHMIDAICTLTALRHLDISQSKDDTGMYEDGTRVLSHLVRCLPKLMSLDISGTNLAGRGVASESGGDGTCVPASDIPGLSARMDNPFHYLGLYETSHDACLRHHIPAKLIAGNANEEQILVAALAFIDRTDMLQKVLNELFHLLRFESCSYVGQALNIVLDAMGRHLHEKHVQISGSATLFYIVKGTGKELHDVVRVKRRIISTLLNGMSEHRSDETMMRNGCLTLCQFKIPADVLFDYVRLVDILLYSVYGMQQESFVQRIGIYLLNSLACQVDGHQKVKLGELGAIHKMISLITDRVERGLCDDVLEVAWSTMWNVTDETPSNCRIFLENHGMQYFLLCLERFPNKEELLRNMMGLLGNVAEVRTLRRHLVTDKYLSVFSDLLDSRSDGIEVSYNAAGVIAHVASDGPDVWHVATPGRDEVLAKMAEAVDRWDLESQRNINYRSFEPILYLVKVYHTPECQKWAVWALANLTKVYPEKYCWLIEKEGGLILLRELIENNLPPPTVKDLARIVIENCRKYKEMEMWTTDVEAAAAHLDG